jgi:hypothetical protein
VGINGNKVFTGITEMVDSLPGDLETPYNCRALAERLFSTKTAVEQIVKGLS